MKENYYTKEFIYTMKSIYILIPFYQLNNQFSLSSVKNTFNFKFAINSGMFKAYKDLGFPDRNSETLNAIYKLDLSKNTH